MRSAIRLLSSCHFEDRGRYIQLANSVPLAKSSCFGSNRIPAPCAPARRLSERRHGFPVSRHGHGQTHRLSTAPAGPEPPPVRIEVHNGSAKPVVYDLAGEEFLIGSVPGCDLRLPGTSLPPVVCLITRQSDGVRLRKLAPTVPVLVNGQPIPQNALMPLTHGDVVSVGAVDLHMDIA